MAGDHVAEVIGGCRDRRARAPSHTAHWGQRRKRPQRLANEWQIRIDLRRPRWRADPGQTCLQQHARHHGMMHVQLTGDGAARQFLHNIDEQCARVHRSRRSRLEVHHARIWAAKSEGPNGTPGWEGIHLINFAVRHALPLGCRVRRDEDFKCAVKVQPMQYLKAPPPSTPTVIVVIVVPTASWDSISVESCGSKVLDRNFSTLRAPVDATTQRAATTSTSA
jgi:hypothetical protein